MAEHDDKPKAYSYRVADREVTGSGPDPDHLGGIGMYAAGLQQLANEQARRRQSEIETRWYQDLQQYRGRYDKDTQTSLEADKKRSKLFVNMTRPKVKVLDARLTDILFPTDELNWAIEPDLDDDDIPGNTAAEKGGAVAPEAAILAGSAPPVAAEGMPVADQGGLVAQEPPSGAPAHPPMTDTAGLPAPKEAPMSPAQERRVKAKAQAAAVRDELHRQLQESNYSAACMKAIHQGCKYGIGIIKGPITDFRLRRSWKGGRFGRKNDGRPRFDFVDCWSFYPDMDASDIEGCEFIFELHRMSRREVRMLKKRKGFKAEEIDELLKERPEHPDWQETHTEQSDIEGGPTEESSENRYHIWEYHGPIKRDEVDRLANRYAGIDVAGEMMDEDGKDVMQGIVWFCQNKILKVAPYPLDSEDYLYSIFRIDPDESSLFGNGIPAMMRDQQGAMNAAWRAMMDNGALAGLPQFVVNHGLRPVDGKYEIVSGKVWRKESDIDGDAIEVVQVAGLTNELEKIVLMSRQFMDDETNLPLISQGEQSADTTKTAHGMALMANAVNIVFRNAARSFDREMTAPNLTRLYDWNRQHSGKKAIKDLTEDMQVVPRGSSVLLVRDVEAQNLMMILNISVTNPLLGELIQAPQVVRRLFQALQLDEREMVMSDEDIAEAKDRAAAMPPEPDPDIAAKLEIENIKAQAQLQVAQMNLQSEMVKLSNETGVALEKIKADLQKTKMTTDSNERLTAAEFALKQQHGTGI